MQLGDLVKDKVTGFTGVIISEHKFLNGCIRVTLQPRELSKEGNVKSTEAFDIQQLEMVEMGAVKLDTPRVKKAPPGGPPLREPIRC